nr:hypothetical protein [Kibdelosporangium sp. MJ126-NF4]CEL23350.1 hypothetical protein [Kibdelosporangium sp. MJ126-NF4]CTQ94512.1 hypothetical protein [Kibdelosporangium sp. MJ126-NF4]
MTTTNELFSGSPTDTQMDEQAEQFVDDVDELSTGESLDERGREQIVELPDTVELPDDEVLPAPPSSSTPQAGPVGEPTAADNARSVWRRSVELGQPLTGPELADQFVESAQWGWDRIAEVVRGEENPRGFARDLWQASTAIGRPLTGRELGEWCGRSERWGRDRIAEVRQASADDTAATTPARRSRTGKPTNGKPRPAAHDSAKRQQTEHVTVDSGTPDTGAVQQVQRNAPTRRDESTAETATTVTAHPVPLPGGARLVAWAGFLFGTAISVAANVLYAWLPTLAGRAGPPGLAPQIGAAVWPIALVISVEVLSRVAWRPGWAWQFARYGGAGVVALGAAVISYGHLSGVLTHWGYGTTGAAVGPLVVDGLMTISGFALLAMSHGGTNGTGSGTAASR